LKYSLFFTSLLSLSVFASINDAPPSFNYQNDKAIFIDFENANYEITYDLTSKRAEVYSLIEFESLSEGFPIFDLVQDPTEVVLDGKIIQTETIADPDNSSTFRIMKDKIYPGKHELRVKHALITNVIYSDSGIGSGFWMSDLTDRKYLEQYLPTNLEFDQYQMRSVVKVKNAEGIPHTIKTNGTLSKISENHFEIIYPDFYTTSSMFFHLFPEKTAINNVQFYYPSIDGRMIPVDIYTGYNADEFVRDTKIILEELETDYGPFPHNQVIIYGNNLSGGMEYSGATSTSLKALGHELFHSYHARGLMPASGNSGWMDEAIARWRDNRYPLIDKLNYESTQLAGHSPWTRKTDRMAYTEGSAFLSWIGYRMNENGISMKTFLRDYFQKYKYTSVTTELFNKEMSHASGLNLTPEFMKYIYGKSVNSSEKMRSTTLYEKEDPFHPIYTDSELRDLSSLGGVILTK
jgi:hypothetical protein